MNCVPLSCCQFVFVQFPQIFNTSLSQVELFLFMFHWEVLQLCLGRGSWMFPLLEELGDPIGMGQQAGSGDTERMDFSLSRAAFSSGKEELPPSRTEMDFFPLFFFFGRQRGKYPPVFPTLTHLSQFQLSEQCCHLKNQIFSLLSYLEQGRF